MGIYVLLHDGLGNQLFQYTMGRLIAEKYNVKLILNFFKCKNDSTIKFDKLGLTFDSKINNSNEFHHIDTNNFNKLINEKLNISHLDFQIYSHIEDYLLYKPHIKQIKSWFTPIKKENFEDLVIHWRAGNDIIHMNALSNQPTEEEFENIFTKIKFRNLFIVSDCKKHNTWEMKDVLDLIEIQRNRSIKEKHPKEQLESLKLLYNPEKTLEFINKRLPFFQKYNPIWINNEDSIQDFNIIRKFDKILITASTFGWWAAFLSDASEIYSYAPWKPSKISSNKNLGKADYPNWNQWGNI
jgi:hypothetical protein